MCHQCCFFLLGLTAWATWPCLQASTNAGQSNKATLATLKSRSSSSELETTRMWAKKPWNISKHSNLLALPGGVRTNYPILSSPLQPILDGRTRKKTAHLTAETRNLTKPTRLLNWRRHSSSAPAHLLSKSLRSPLPPLFERRHPEPAMESANVPQFLPCRIPAYGLLLANLIVIRVSSHDLVVQLLPFRHLDALADGLADCVSPRPPVVSICPPHWWYRWRCAVLHLFDLSVRPPFADGCIWNMFEEIGPDHCDRHRSSSPSRRSSPPRGCTP